MNSAWKISRPNRKPAAYSTINVAWDQFHGNPEPMVMKWGFVLVTVYMGPIGLLLHVTADKEPAPVGGPEDDLELRV